MGWDGTAKVQSYRNSVRISAAVITCPVPAVVVRRSPTSVRRTARTSRRTGTAGTANSMFRAVQTHINYDRC